MCEDTLGSGNIMDSGTILFTVDNQPPVTNILTETYAGSGIYEPFDETKAYYDPFIILDCQDPDIPTDNSLFKPGEFKCSHTLFCLGTTSCTPNQVFDEFIKMTDYISIDTGTYVICYNSFDNGNNQESVTCTDIIIDQTPPSVSLTSPTNLQPLNNNINIDVTGSWLDNSDKVSIGIRVVDESASLQKYW